ncbi:beta-glucosidase [Paenibacillus swuensis]|uniref:beta-N-acetylhexosaminidase n=1 Tax=Paenibacillus swuensis TaxID=1178515 RepID=A0A172TMF1_9BACL|nr:beta-N-acetylhexosaminidase [Paenibacillus swuensis]ANE48208.1 beta-glucosidase [Paenibacillus swuensis]
MEFSRWTLEQKIGQMILGGFEGTEPAEHVRTMIKDHHMGGVIYFARNVRHPAQVAALSRDLQLMAAEAGQPPLWISIDQEGGMVARITEGVALMPGAMALAAGGSAEAAYESAKISGTELRALGINLNFAPDLDINVNAMNPVIGVRSFGEQPDRVAELGVQTLRGYQDANVVATAKHFPGHGDTHIDSHLDLPVITHSSERIRSVELVPFIKAVEAGVDSVMSAHIRFPAFDDSGVPVTLSHRVLTGLLREELGFAGVIMTDCMEMKAIADHYGTVHAAVMAVEAGADLVLISHSLELQAGAAAALVEAVRSGRISEERIDQSVERLLALKAKRALAAEPGDFSRIVNTPEHRSAAERFSEASITLVKDTAGLLPLAAKPTLVLTVEPAAVSLVDESYGERATLGSALAAEGIDVRERVIPLTKAGELTQEMLKEAGWYEQIVVGTYNAHLHPDQVSLVRALLALGKQPVVAALRNPYDLQAYADVPAYVCLYESRPLALQSAAKLMSGALVPQGKLPVTIGESYPAGWGVTSFVR